MKLFRWKQRKDEELNVEVQQHLDAAIRDRMERGETADEARANVLREFGNVGLVKEVTREMWDWASLERLGQDLRFGLRMLRKQPGFSLTAILTLALGIGANTALFSILNTYLFRALPYPNQTELVRVFRTSPHSQRWPHSVPGYLEQRAQTGMFAYVAGFQGINPNLAEEGDVAERLQGMAVTADFFPALSVQAALGRGFTTEEEQPGANAVAVLSDRFWQRRFGGDSAIIGRTLRLDGQNIKVIGVMPPGFDHPLLWGNVDVWRPLAFTPEQRQNWENHYLWTFARLKPGVSQAQAQAALTVLAANIAKEHAGNRNDGLRLELLQQSTSDDIGRKVMWFTFGLAGCLLLIACANIANLQLVRTTARAREFAVRLALGAGRLRLLRQSLTESLLISLLGGALSFVFASFGAEFLSKRLFSELPGVKVTLDWRVFGFALLCSVLTGVVFGLVPAWFASRMNVNQALKENLRGGHGQAQHRLRHTLIIGEITFALVLLAGAGFFLRGLYRFTQHDPGWRVDGLLTAQLGLRGTNYAQPDQRRAFYQRLEERLRVLPGVEQVAVTSGNPVWRMDGSGSFRIEGQPEPPPGQWPETYFERASPAYFETLGIRLLEGRAFTAADTAAIHPVAIINESLARRYWPNESAVGKRLGRMGNDPDWHEIVGVVNDVAFPGTLGQPDTRFQTFRPVAQGTLSTVTLLIRTSMPPETLSNALRSAVAELDPTQPVHRLRTARSQVEQGLGNVSLLSSLLGAFAVLGLVLAALGLYGVISYTVAQRTGEIGIRLALGAQSRNVLWLVLGRSLRLILAGVLLGLGGAYALGRFLMTAIPTLPTRDPVVLIVIALLLMVVALLACWIPARRATKIDPLTALRHD
jgi:putative ABC transport system permease protein